MEISKRLKALREEMSRHSIDAYIVPTCDFHGSEYIGDYFKTREYITGFTGSAGTAIITQKQALLWTDGRYYIQAEKELNGSGILLMKDGTLGVVTPIQYLDENTGETEVIGFDGRMISSNMAEKISDIRTVKSDVDLIDNIWHNRPSMSAKPVWILDEKYAGKSARDKLTEICNEINNACDIMIITALDEIAWTLNLRGNDVDYCPVFMSYMLFAKDGIKLFVQPETINEEVETYLKNLDVEILDYVNIFDYVSTINDSTVWLDQNSTNYNIVKSLKSNNTILDKRTPAYEMKAIKNAVEIQNMKKAHLLDGVAVTKFIYWLKTNVGKCKMTEMSLSKKLEEFRREADSFLEPSFETIVGYKEHGAIVHYSATKETDYEIKSEGIVLIDSGGHYLEGTTDITRTISLGKVDEDMKELYTAVLKGNLELTAAVFKEGCCGVNIDYLARQALWAKGLDYNHGTGHGVGYLLNVHEGPNGIRSKIMPKLEMNTVFEAGMITSNEPGVYLENRFGIRLENLILCVENNVTKDGRFLSFEPLTLVPFDKELIDIDQMTEEEVKHLEQYNKKVYENISPYLTKEEKAWLQEEMFIK